MGLRDCIKVYILLFFIQYFDINSYSYNEDQHLKLFCNWNYVFDANCLRISYFSTKRRKTLYKISFALYTTLAVTMDNFITR